MSKDNREKFYYTDAGGREKTIKWYTSVTTTSKEKLYRRKKTQGWYHIKCSLCWRSRSASFSHLPTSTVWLYCFNSGVKIISKNKSNGAKIMPQGNVCNIRMRNKGYTKLYMQYNSKKDQRKKSWIKRNRKKKSNVSLGWERFWVISLLFSGLCDVIFTYNLHPCILCPQPQAHSQDCFKLVLVYVHPWRSWWMEFSSKEKHLILTFTPTRDSVISTKQILMFGEDPW